MAVTIEQLERMVADRRAALRTAEQALAEAKAEANPPKPVRIPDHGDAEPCKVLEAAARGACAYAPPVCGLKCQLADIENLGRQ